MKIGDLDFENEFRSMTIWIDAHLPEPNPSLAIVIRAKGQKGWIDDGNMAVTPSISCGFGLSIRNWEDLEGLEFSDRNDGRLSGDFDAWFGNPQMSDMECFSVKVLKRDGESFVVECSAEACVHDMGGERSAGRVP